MYHLFHSSIPHSSYRLGRGRQLSSESHLEQWIPQDGLKLPCGFPSAPPCPRCTRHSHAPQKAVRGYAVTAVTKILPWRPPYSHILELWWLANLFMFTSNKNIIFEKLCNKTFNVLKSILAILSQDHFPYSILKTKHFNLAITFHGPFTFSIIQYTFK